MWVSRSAPKILQIPLVALILALRLEQPSTRPIPPLPQLSIREGKRCLVTKMEVD